MKIITNQPTPPPPPPVTYDIVELSCEAARTLYAILNRVGGDPHCTPRGDIDDLRRSLWEAGVRESDDLEFVNGCSSIYFK